MTFENDDLTSWLQTNCSCCIKLSSVIWINNGNLLQSAHKAIELPPPYPARPLVAPQYGDATWPDYFHLGNAPSLCMSHNGAKVFLVKVDFFFFVLISSVIWINNGNLLQWAHKAIEPPPPYPARPLAAPQRATLPDPIIFTLETLLPCVCLTMRPKYLLVKVDFFSLQRSVNLRMTFWCL